VKFIAILKFIKLGLSVLLITTIFLSLNIRFAGALSWNKKEEIDDRKLDLIIEELKLSDYKGIIYINGRVLCTRSELKDALNIPIDSEKSSLTFGGYILTALYEKNLIKSVASREYVKKADALWNAILDVNVPIQLTQIGSEEILVGLIEEAGGFGMGESILLKIPKILETGVAIKTLKKELFGNELRFYFEQRSQGTPSNEMYICSDIFTCKEVDPDQKEYYESLWETWGKYFTPTGARKNIDSDTQEKLRNILEIALEKLNESKALEKAKTLIKEKPALKEKSLLQKIKDIPQNISESVSHFFEEKKEQVENAIERQIEKTKKKVEKKVEEVALETQKRIEREIEKQVEKQVKEFEKEMERACAIKTVYGESPELIVLRDFRNKFLLKNNLGKRFVNFYYYHFSPPIAQFLSDKVFLKGVTREVISEPIVYTMRVTQMVWDKN